MPRLDVAPDYTLLVQVLREPERLLSLSSHQWSRAIDVAEHARLIGWFLNHVPPDGPGPDAPEWLKDRFVSAVSTAAEYDRSVRWEIDRLRRAFAASGINWVLLKGAGYLAAGLAPGRGRRVADIDILVAEADVPQAERLLKARGWEFGALDPYDERFYREWMHELPPMVHRERRSIVDLHHSILPRIGRLHPPTARLLGRSVEAEPGVRVLCPSHMVLHAAAHLFHDGEISGAIRDLVDLDGLIRAFQQDPTFCDDLVNEARALELTRPAYYALRFAQRLLNTPVDAKLMADTAGWGPRRLIRSIMDALVERTLGGTHTAGAEAAALALYVRAHWLRMPPVMLTRHLLHQSMRSR